MAKIAGVRCYENADELSLVLDAAFLAIRGDPQLKEGGSFGCVCYIAGFSESYNQQLQKVLIDAAGDMALVGTNYYGVIIFLEQTPLF